MVAGRFMAAMSDLAETIRRAFQDPPSHRVPVGWAEPRSGRAGILEAKASGPFAPFAPVTAGSNLIQAGSPVTAPLAWAPSVTAEPGLGDWAAGVRVSAPPLFRADRCGRLEAPALPRRAESRRQCPAFPAPAARAGWSAPAAPASRPGLQPLEAGRTFPGLRKVLDLPVAVAGEDLTRISKALWMRYTLQLVRATGENIRNLEVVGLYRIPTKGTRQVHQDPASGRLLVTLGPESRNARRGLFMLARRRSDGSVVCSFVEET
jgi:hypothetical protein